MFTSRESSKAGPLNGGDDVPGRDLTKSPGQRCNGQTLEVLCDESRARHLTEGGRERRMIHSRLKNNTRIVLSSFCLSPVTPFIPLSESLMPFMPLKCYAVVIFLPFAFLLCFLLLLLLLPLPTPSLPGALGGSPL